MTPNIFFRNILITETPLACSRLPSVVVERKTRDKHSKGVKKAVVPSKTFSEIFGKSIDEAKCECSLSNLSHNWEWFFEIYFVRLIGTPNQHYSKIRAFGFESFLSSS